MEGPSIYNFKFCCVVEEKYHHLVEIGVISLKLFVPNLFDLAITIFGNLFRIFRHFKFSFLSVCVKNYSILDGNGTLSLFHRYIFWPHPSTSLVIESETLRPGLFISINIILIISTAHLKSQEGTKTKGQNSVKSCKVADSSF